MYGHNTDAASSENYAYGGLLAAGFGGNFQVAAPLPPALIIPAYDFYSASLLKPEVGCSSGSSSYGSPSSITSQSQMTPRRPSFHRLLSPHPELSGSVTSSAGDLKTMKVEENRSWSWESPMSEEKSIMESMQRACKYNPEEKKERIQRYKSKRSQRNFNKKIKYECRKTLADSRPRIRGRFARNEETETTNKTHENDGWSYVAGNEGDEEYDIWINSLASV